MKNVRRILTSIAFTLVLALSLTATSSEAYAKGKGGPVRQTTADQIAPSPAGAFQALGVTWE